MKALLLLLLCIPTYAQPIPRPAPLKSPRDASQPKAAPMLKVFTPAGDSETFWIPMTIRNRKNLNFNQCDTNDPNCLLFDMDDGKASQPTGAGIQVEFANTIDATEWVWVARFWPPPYPVDSEFSWIYYSWQRPTMRFYRSVPYVPPTGFAPASGQPVVNPDLKGVIRATTRRK